MKIYPKNLLPVLILFWIFSGEIALGHSIKGNVVDVKGNPISFATIFIKELAKGVSTGEKGTFSIPLESGTYTLKFQCVGYQPEIKQVKLTTKDEEIKVVLKEMTYTLSEVVISGHENPANRIMRATITRSQFFHKMLESYTADVYVKVNFKIDKLSRLVKYMSKDDKDMPKVGKLQFAESHNQVTYVVPDRYTQKVLKTEKSGTIFGDEGIPGVHFLLLNVYQPTYNGIPSPLGQNAFSYYNFYLSGISVMGTYSIYKIKFTPKRPGMFFEGFIYINSSNYFVNNLDWNAEISFQKYNLKMDFDVFQDVIDLPSSFNLNFEFEIMGNKVSGLSSSSISYTTLKVNETARLYAKDEKKTEPVKKEDRNPKQIKKQQKLEDDMNKLMGKKDMSLKDMNKFINTMKKLDKATQKDTVKSLEVKDPIVIIKDSLYNRHDTLYWRNVRPVELSLEERQAEKEIDSVYRAKLNDTLPDKVKKDTLHPKKIGDILTKVFLGGNFSKDSIYRFHLSGLLNNNTYFTPIDGFTLGTILTFNRYSHKENRDYTISFTPSYAFSRREFMSEGRIGYTFSRIKQASLFLEAYSKSRDFYSQYPADLFINSLSSLFLFDNKVKQFHDQAIRLTGSLGISNGLITNAGIEYHKRELLHNTTNYSFSRNDTAYKPNEPGNIYESSHPMRNHDQFFLQVGIKYTFRNKYMMRQNRKYDLGSAYPTLGINYTQGIQGVGESVSNFSRLSVSLEKTKHLGLLSQVWGKVEAGNSYNTSKLQLPDFYQPNVTALAFDFRDTKTSFLLMPAYVYSTPSWFVDAHFRYNTSSLLIKRLPWIGEKLFTETITLAYYNSDEYRNYVEAGYGFGNIFFMGSLQAVVGFTDGKYSTWGVRAFFSIK